MASHHATTNHNNAATLQKVKAAITMLSPHKDNLPFKRGKEYKPHTFIKRSLDHLVWMDAVVL